MTSKFKWDDEAVLAFAQVVSGGSYGNYSGCRYTWQKLEKFKEVYDPKEPCVKRGRIL
jgi:membrane-bound inhibitor of C-type lysozyme